MNNQYCIVSFALMFTFCTLGKTVAQKHKNRNSIIKVAKAAKKIIDFTIDPRELRIEDSIVLYEPDRNTSCSKILH